MFGDEATTNFHFCIEAKRIGEGLEEQIQGFVRKHPDTKLVIIDVLQSVRADTGGIDYKSDYAVVSKIKKIADENRICILLVHHTRKQESSDKFEEISGTNGLLGASDGALVLQKEKRVENGAILEVVGRDIPDQKIHIFRNNEKLCWEFDHAETELWQEPADPILEAVSLLGNWQGTPTELLSSLKLDIPVNSLSRHLNIKAGKLQKDFGIIYKNIRNSKGIIITLSKTL
jgi:hypothetical protein